MTVMQPIPQASASAAMPDLSQLHSGLELELNRCTTLARAVDTTLDELQAGSTVDFEVLDRLICLNDMLEERFANMRAISNSVWEWGRGLGHASAALNSAASAVDAESALGRFVDWRRRQDFEAALADLEAANALVQEVPEDEDVDDVVEGQQTPALLKMLTTPVADIGQVRQKLAQIIRENGDVECAGQSMLAPVLDDLLYLERQEG